MSHPRLPEGRSIASRSAPHHEESHNIPVFSGLIVALWCDGGEQAARTACRGGCAGHGRQVVCHTLLVPSPGTGRWGKRSASCADGRSREPQERGGHVAQEYAVIDSETTGLGPSDRIVEFACNVLDAHGCVLQRFETLIDPGRVPGPTRIHGVTQVMSKSAPSFGALARRLFHLLNGRVVVGHNLAFDWMMLRKEFQRLGVRIPSTPGGVCTADWSESVLGSRHSLEAACDALGITNPRPHQAGSDAEATVGVFNRLGTLAHCPPHRSLVMGHRLGALPPARAPLPRAACGTQLAPAEAIAQ